VHPSLDGSPEVERPANLRHDLLAVVHTLLGAIELLLTTRMSPRQRRYVNVCSRSAEHLTELCRQVASPVDAPASHRLAIDDLSELGVSYVPKPVSRAGLIDAVKTLVEGKRLRVLVADDSANSCALVDEFLKGTATRLDIVHDGLSALEKYQRGKGNYDLLVIDLDMPVMDGRTAIRGIRGWETRHGKPHTPIVVLTAHDLIGHQLSDGEAVIEDPDPDLAHLVPAFLAGRRQDVLTVLHALTDSNYDAITTMGHILKSAGGVYGLDGITEIGGKLEEGGLRQDFYQIREAVAALDSYLNRVTLLKALPAPSDLTNPSHTFVS
jgi:CheY-like chemotaxis protein